MKHNVHILTELEEFHVWNYLASIEINRKYETKQDNRRLVQIPVSGTKKIDLPSYIVTTSNLKQYQ